MAQNVNLINVDFSSGSFPADWDYNDGNLLWNISNASTPTNGTGISGVNDYRVWVESSGTVAGQEAWLITEEIDLMNDSISLTLNFDLGMYGSTMGTMHIDIYDVDQDSYTNSVWSLTGDQGDSWQSQSVDLSSYTDKIRVRFRAVIGDATYSDFELDNIVLVKEQHDNIDDILLDRTIRCTIPEEKQYPDEIYWPLLNGDTHVCLWKDGKNACFSFTIDDNWEADQPWWTTQYNTYGYNFTWFAVSNWIGSTNGTWSGFNALYDDGHAIESHSHTHPAISDETTARTEFSASITSLEANIPENNVKTFAWPMGDASQATIAEEYFLAARGTEGGFNTPWPSMYNTKNVEAVNLSDNTTGSTYVPNLLDSGALTYRGWAVYLFHGMNTDGKAAFITLLDYLQTNDSEFWVATYPEAAQYIHARNNATISGTNLNNKITVSNSIDLSGLNANVQGLVEEPLTFKTKIPSTWTSPTITQNGQPLTYSIVTNANGRFAIYDAFPDGNDIEIVNLTEYEGSTTVNVTTTGQFESTNLFTGSASITNTASGEFEQAQIFEGAVQISVTATGGFYSEGIEPVIPVDEEDISIIDRFREIDIRIIDQVVRGG